MIIFLFSLQNSRSSPASTTINTPSRHGLLRHSLWPHTPRNPPSATRHRRIVRHRHHRPTSPHRHRQTLRFQSLVITAPMFQGRKCWSFDVKLVHLVRTYTTLIKLGVWWGGCSVQSCHVALRPQLYPSKEQENMQMTSPFSERVRSHYARRPHHS